MRYVILLTLALLTACGGGDPEDDETTCTVSQCTNPK
jgi:hypothetical protein